MSIGCATEGCNNPADWISIAEGNKLGSDAPKRCKVCCNAIGEAFYNVSSVQEAQSKPPNWENSMEALHKTLMQPYEKD